MYIYFIYFDLNYYELLIHLIYNMKSLNIFFQFNSLNDIYI